MSESKLLVYSWRREEYQNHLGSETIKYVRYDLNNTPVVTITKSRPGDYYDVNAGNIYGIKYKDRIGKRNPWFRNYNRYLFCFLYFAKRAADKMLKKAGYEFIDKRYESLR